LSEFQALDIINQSTLPRSRVYEILSSLAAKNLLQKNSNSNYTVIPPKQAIEKLKQNLESEYNQKLEKIDEIANHLHNVWSNNLAADISPGVELYSYSHAEPLFLDHLKNVKQRILIAASSGINAFDWKKSGMILSQVYNENIKIKYLISDDEMYSRIKLKFSQFPPFQNLKIEIKSSENLFTSFIILDNIVYIFFIVSEGGLNTTLMRTASEGLVKSFEWMFNQLWNEKIKK